jgi:L-glutamine---4-(methylsulfanyl)-2-oxobutanoate aminotransferase
MRIGGFMMKIEPANRINALPRQFFSNLVSRVNKQISQGKDVINLGQGNPDLPTPEHIVESLRNAVLDPTTHRYPPFSGLQSLKEAVSAFYKKQYNVSIDPETEVSILFGSKTGLVEISQIFLNPGDVALVTDPGYPDYASGIALAGGVMRKIPLYEELGYMPKLKAIDLETRKLGKIFFLNYPQNPTGAMATPGFFQDLANFADENEIIIVHDFAYAAIGFDGVSPPSFLQAPGAKEVGIEIYTMSKTYNMAGWRVGFAVGNSSVIRNINLMQDHYYTSLFPAIQIAAATALNGPQDGVLDLVKVYESRRNAFVNELRQHGYQCPPPKGGFFAWLPVPKGYNSVQFSDMLLDQADVCVAPGVGFGQLGDGHVRVGLLTPEDRLREAARRIVSALK